MIFLMAQGAGSTAGAFLDLSYSAALARVSSVAVMTSGARGGLSSPLSLAGASGMEAYAGGAYNEFYIEGFFAGSMGMKEFGESVIGMDLSKVPGALGLSFKYLSLGSLEAVGSSAESLGKTLSLSAYVVELGYGLTMKNLGPGNLGAGLLVGYLSNSLGVESYSGVMASLGASYSMKLGRDEVSVALWGDQLGAMVSGDNSLLAMKPLLGAVYSTSISEGIPLKVGFRAGYGIMEGEYDLSVAASGGYSLPNLGDIELSAGYNVPAGIVSGGLGFVYTAMKGNMKPALDLAVSYSGLLGLKIYLSVGSTF